LAKNFEHSNWVRGLLTLSGLGAAYAIGVVNLGDEKPPLVLKEVASDQPPAQTEQLTVHVIGQVRKPGLYALPKGSRVNDAILMAGGKTDKADTDLLNLAEPVGDGEQVDVPAKGAINPPIQPFATLEGDIQKRQPATRSSSQKRPPASTSKAPPRTQAPKPKKKGEDLAIASISINTASSSQLQRLPGIGPATASNIIGHRREHGYFRSIDDLLAVRGIGPKKLEAIRKYIRL